MYAINGLLPEEYRVIISSLEYNELTRKDVFAVCLECEKECDFKTLEIVNLILNQLDQLIVGSSSAKCWVCPKCKYTNELVKTSLVQKVLKEPYFLKVVPKPPLRREGMNDRTSYHNKVSRWIWTMLAELESRLAQFRDDNWQKGSDLTSEYDVEVDENDLK